MSKFTPDILSDNPVLSVAVVKLCVVGVSISLFKTYIIFKSKVLLVFPLYNFVVLDPVPLSFLSEYLAWIEWMEELYKATLLSFLVY